MQKREFCAKLNHKEGRGDGGERGRDQRSCYKGGKVLWRRIAGMERGEGRNWGDGKGRAGEGRVGRREEVMCYVNGICVHGGVSLFVYVSRCNVWL